MNLKEKRQRTIQQNRAIHLYYTKLALALSEAGLGMKRTLKPEIDIPWSGDTVKEFIFKPIMKAQLRKFSTTELKTDEVSKVYDTINRFISEKFGVSVAFPSLDELIWEEKVKK